MPRSMRWCIVVLCAVFLTGCATGPVLFEERPNVEKALSRMQTPFPYRVAVVRIGKNKDNPHKAPNISRIAMDMLKKSKMFQSVVSVEAVSFNDALEKARKKGADVIAMGKAAFGGVVYNGHTGWRIPKVIVWSISEFLSALIADEIYTVEASANLDFYSVYNRDRIESVAASTRTQVVLNDYQRGFKLWGIWRVPSSLHKGNFAKIKKAAVDNVEEDLKEKLFFRLLERLEPVRLARLIGKPKPKPKTTKRKPPVEVKPKKKEGCEVFLIALGRDTDGTPSAERSASAFIQRAEVLLTKESVTRALLGRSARLSRLESEVESMKAKDVKVKTVVLYLALPALASDGVKVRLADGYQRLSELVRRLRLLTPKRILLFCDLFAPEGSWEFSAGEDTLALFARKPGEKYLLKDGVTLFCAAFASVLRVADSNNDGMVKSEELAEMAGVWMRRQSRLLKAYQTPYVTGEAEIPLAAR